MSPSVLAVGFFSSRGPLADDFATLTSALADRSQLYVLTTTVLRDRTPAAARDAHCLRLSKRSPLGFVNPATWWTAVRFARQRPFDLLFVHTEHPAHPVVSATARARRRVFWCHDPVPHSGSRPAYVLIYHLSRRLLIAGADRILVSCDALKREVVTRYGAAAERVRGCPLVTLHNLVFSDLMGSARDVDILFFGRRERYKGLDVLQQALRNLADQGLSPRVVIAGPGSEPMAPAPGVTLLDGYVEDRKLAGLIARARVVVLPYRDATGSQAPQVALAYGTPVVATATGCFPEYVGHEAGGLIVPPADAGALAQALHRLLTDLPLWERLSRGARERSARLFGVDRAVDVILEEA